MRRELRRHPVQAKPTRGTNRPVRVPRTPAARTGAAPAAGRIRGLPTVLQPAWIREIWTELKKVQWPTRQETINLTIVVIVVSVALGLFLGGLDAAFNWIIEHTLLV
jgi:preprotein translocase subunit SecE